MAKSKMPEDLGLKIGTPEEVVWTNVLKTAEQNVETAKNEILVGEAMIELAKARIDAEKKKV